MFEHHHHGIRFIGIVLEGFLYGLYTGIFAMYLKYQGPQKDSDKKRNIIFCSICALYVLSIILFAADTTQLIYQLRKPMELALRTYYLNVVLIGLCDLIAQFILIYRCWIVWGRNIRVVIIPSILAFACIVSWLAAGKSTYIRSGRPESLCWGYWMYLLTLSLALTVNALVTGLIVFRIFKVFQEVKATSNDQILCTTGGSKLRRAILVLIESGMALFSIQLALLVVTIVGTRADTAFKFLTIIFPIHNMLNSITPTIILVRTSMGLSFHDEKSMEDVIGSMCYASNNPNSVTETRSNFIVGQDGRDDDIGIQPSNDIDILER